MITGAHTIIYSSDAEADRLFLLEKIGLAGTDAGGGWLIFGLPPSEVAIHPSENNGVHELYLLCEDIRDFVSEMKSKDVPCTDVQEMPWGLLVSITLPGGGRLGVYEALHARP